MSKAVLFQAIQFSISTLFNSIWPIDRTLLGATTQGQNGPGSDGITGASSSNCLVSYLGHSLGGSLIPLQRCSQCILQSQLTRQLVDYPGSNPKQTLSG